MREYQKSITFCDIYFLLIFILYLQGNKNQPCFGFKFYTILKADHSIIGIIIMATWGQRHQEFCFGNSKLVFFFEEEQANRKKDSMIEHGKKVQKKPHTVSVVSKMPKLKENNTMITKREMKPKTAANTKRSHRFQHGGLRVGTAIGVNRTERTVKKQREVTKIEVKQLCKQPTDNPPQQATQFHRLSHTEIKHFHGPLHLLYRQSLDYLNLGKSSHQQKCENFLSVYREMVTKFQLYCEKECRVAFGMGKETKIGYARVYFYKSEEVDSLAHRLKLCYEIDPVEPKAFRLKPGHYKVFYEDSKKLLLDIFSHIPSQARKQKPTSYPIKIISNQPLKLSHPQILQKYEGRIEDSQNFYCSTPTPT